MNKEIDLKYIETRIFINIDFVFRIIEALEENDFNRIDVLSNELEKELFDIDEGELARYLQALRGICPTFSPQ